MTKINVDDGKTKKIVVTEKKPVRKIAVEKPAEKKSAPAKKKIEISGASKKPVKAEKKPVEAKEKPVQKIRINTTSKKKIAIHAVSSAETHSSVQKSTTLSRKYVKKPVKVEVNAAPKTEIDAAPKAEIKPEPKAEAKPQPKVESTVEVKSEPSVKIMPEPKTEIKPESSVKIMPEPKTEIKPEPTVKIEPEPKVEAKPTQPAIITTAPQSRTEVKSVRRSPRIIRKSSNSDRALKAAARAVKRAERAERKAEKKAVPDIEHRFRKKNRGRRVFFAMLCSAATVGALVAFVNINMPDISVRVAAMQTGIEATYPTFVPRYYSLANVESDKDGIVTMRFNGPDGASFTLSEEKSTWDSNALLNNYVKKYYPADYVTLREQGITIYTRGENSAWVNGGLLYKIESTGKYLTKEQIRNIATSL